MVAMQAERQRSRARRDTMKDDGYKELAGLLAGGSKRRRQASLRASAGSLPVCDCGGEPHGPYCATVLAGDTPPISENHAKRRKREKWIKRYSGYFGPPTRLEDYRKAEITFNELYRSSMKMAESMTTEAGYTEPGTLDDE